MEKRMKVEICPRCSGIGAGAFGGGVKVKAGCIGKCAKKHPELDGKVYGYLNGAFAVAPTPEAFAERAGSPGGPAVGGDPDPEADPFPGAARRWRAELRLLRAIALDCGLEEDLRWGRLCYRIAGGNVLMLGGFSKYVSILFVKGALLRDPDAVLVRRTDPVQAGRRLRFAGAEEIVRRERTIRAFIGQAIAVERAGEKAPAEGGNGGPILEALRDRFARQPALEVAFYALSPGRRRDYLRYFSEPKMPKARADRIDRCARRILGGKGLDG